MGILILRAAGSGLLTCLPGSLNMLANVPPRVPRFDLEVLQDWRDFLKYLSAGKEGLGRAHHHFTVTDDFGFGGFFETIMRHF